MVANHSHILWTCHKIKIFWDGIILILKEILGYEIPYDPKLLYLGLKSEDVVLKKDLYRCKILLLACKKTIAKN